MIRNGTHLTDLSGPHGNKNGLSKLYNGPIMGNSGVAQALGVTVGFDPLPIPSKKYNSVGSSEKGLAVAPHKPATPKNSGNQSSC